ncbi:hypothetical protein [Arachidicoccus sp.]|uniref:hypothetical protein n=1 Tax=Arachidicoccus sp. TaxID=1872624 RepID=UPI003D193D80
MKNKHQEDLSHIRAMMERSSRFISLSGLSGILAGITALVGVAIGLYIFHLHGYAYNFSGRAVYSTKIVSQLVVTAIIILLLSIFGGIYFTIRKSKKEDLPIWTNTTKQLLINLFVPLIAGGIFCCALLYHQLFIFITPATLLFYGLALINASKYTYDEIYYLGIFEIILGLAAAFFLEKGLLFWAIGFGLLHILYGIKMYRKYN